MILQIYTEKKTNRLEYILDFFFNSVLGIKYQIFNTIDALNVNQAILNYSSKKIEQSFQIIPAQLLFEDHISPQEIVVENGYYFFKTNGKDFPFDVLAASFFLITRYEEYLPTELDAHQRFQAKESLAYQHHFLDKAVVNRWAIELKQHLLIQFPQLSFSKKSYHFISTIDIDNAYAFKAKGLIRIAGGFLKALMKADFEDLKYRILFVLGFSKDVFDAYDKFDALHQQHKIKSLYFFLVGKNSAFDKNIPISKIDYQKLIQTLSKKSELGIHPSYQSNYNEAYLKEEFEGLEKVLGRTVTNSRQHFLKFELPNTYNRLLELGVQNEYSMGYASQLGFRAGVANPFYFFDLKKNQKTNLLVVPFQVMDGTLNQYLKLSPEEAIAEIVKINQEVRQVNGLFVSLWHNESLSEIRNWKSWTKVYEKLIEIAKV